MKRWLLVLLVLLFAFPTPVDAEGTDWPEAPKPKMSVYAGDGSDYIWDDTLEKAAFFNPMGIEADDKGTLWVWDGITLRRIAGGKVESVASLWDLEAELKPYKLDSTAAIMSFNFVQMETYKDEVYVSGLMFYQDRVLDPDSARESETRGCACRQWRMGDVYNMLLRYKNGELSIVDLSWATEKIWDERYIQTFDAEAGAMGGAGNGLYAYHWRVLWPHFQIDDNGTIYLIRRRDDDIRPTGPFSRNSWKHEVVRFKNGESTILFRDQTPYQEERVLSSGEKGWQDHYISVSDNEMTATIYSGQRRKVYQLDLTQPLPPIKDNFYRSAANENPITSTGSRISAHPEWHNGALYFLDDQGIWRPMAGDTWIEETLNQTDILDVPENITFADWTIAPDGTVYLISYRDRQIMQIKDTPFSNRSDIWQIMIPGQKIEARPAVQMVDGQLMIPLDPLAEVFPMQIHKDKVITYSGRHIPVKQHRINDLPYLSLSEVQRVWLDKMWPSYHVEWDEVGRNLIFTPNVQGLPKK